MSFYSESKFLISLFLVNYSSVCYWLVTHNRLKIKIQRIVSHLPLGTESGVASWDIFLGLRGLGFSSLNKECVTWYYAIQKCEYLTPLGVICILKLVSQMNVYWTEYLQIFFFNWQRNWCLSACKNLDFEYLQKFELIVCDLD